MAKIKMYFEGDTGYPAFSKLQVARIKEVADWMNLAQRVCDNNVWSDARASLLAVIETIPIEVDDDAAE